MPGYEILGFTGSWESTDALHCRIKGIPDLEMLQIFHNPLNNGIEPVNSEYLLDVVVDDLSGMGTISDSVKVFGESLVLNNGKVDNCIRPIFLKIWTVGWVEFLLLSIQGYQYYIQAADYSSKGKEPIGWLVFFGIAHGCMLELVSWRYGQLWRTQCNRPAST